METRYKCIACSTTDEQVFVEGEQDAESGMLKCEKCGSNELEEVFEQCEVCGHDFLASELTRDKCTACSFEDERVNSPEADEINDEDLEAASDVFDRLGDKNDN